MKITTKHTTNSSVTFVTPKRLRLLLSAVMLRKLTILGKQKKNSSRNTTTIRASRPYFFDSYSFTVALFLLFFSLVGGMSKTMASLQAFPSSLLSRTWSCALIPFPFLSNACHAGLFNLDVVLFLIRLPEIIRTLILLFILLHIYGVATATESYFLPRSQQFLSLV